MLKLLFNSAGCTLKEPITHFCFRFFHESSSPKHLKITFEFFRKFAEIFASQGTPQVSTTPVKNMGTKSDCRRSSFFMLTPLTKGVKKQLKLFWLKFFFIAELQIFEKIQKGPNGILRGLRESDSWKKTYSRKSRDTAPLKGTLWKIRNRFVFHRNLSTWNKGIPAYLDLFEVDVSPGVGLASHLECDLPQSPLQVTVFINTVI